jgi:hypothetical protein
VALSMLTLEMLLYGDIDFPSTNEVKVLNIVSHLHGSSVRNGSGFGTRLDGPVRVVTQITEVPTGSWDGLELDRSSILWFLQLCLQLGNHVRNV